MNASQKHEEASAALLRHQANHYRIKEVYDESLKRFRELDRACSEAWLEMTNASTSA